MAATLDFTEAVQSYFDRYSEPFGTQLRLRSVEQDETVLTVRFRGPDDDSREYGARFRVPAAVGEEQWMEFAQHDSSIFHWAQWGIVLRIVESYDTTADKGSLPYKDGIHWFIFDDSTKNCR